MEKLPDPSGDQRIIELSMKAVWRTIYQIVKILISVNFNRIKQYGIYHPIEKKYNKFISLLIILPPT